MAFWLAIGIIDLVLDLAIAVWASHLVATDRRPRAEKAPLVLAFWARLLAAPFLIIRLASIRDVTRHKSPQEMLRVVTIVTQAQLCLAVFTTCLPYLRLCASKFENGHYSTNMRIIVRRKSKRAAANLTPLQIPVLRAPDRRDADPTAAAARHISVRGSMALSLGSSSLNSARMIISKMTTFWTEEERAPEPDSTPPVPKIDRSFLEV